MEDGNGKAAIQVEESIFVKTRPETIFMVVGEPTHLLLIWPTFTQVRDVQRGSCGISTFRWTRKIAGIEFRGNATCVERVPDQHVVYEFHGDMEGKITWTMHAEKDGTNVTARSEYEASIPLSGRPAEVLVDAWRAAQVGSALRNLKEESARWRRRILSAIELAVLPLVYAVQKALEARNWVRYRSTHIKNGALSDTLRWIHDIRDFRRASADTESAPLRKALDHYLGGPLQDELFDKAVRRSTRYFWAITIGVPMALMIAIGTWAGLESATNMPEWQRFGVGLGVIMPALYVVVLLGIWFIRSGAERYEHSNLVRIMLLLRGALQNTGTGGFWADRRVRLIRGLHKTAQIMVSLGDIVWAGDSVFQMEVRAKFARYGAYLDKLRMEVIAGLDGWEVSVRCKIDRVLLAVLEYRFGDLPEAEVADGQQLRSRARMIGRLVPPALILGGGAVLGVYGPQGLQYLGWGAVSAAAFQVLAPFVGKDFASRISEKIGGPA